MAEKQFNTQPGDVSWEMYNNVCKSRFDTLETKMDAVYGKVTNGLSDKVGSHSKILWTVLFLILGLVAERVFNLI